MKLNWGLLLYKMTVEERREDPSDQFPVGMRVLAVDDDPICLKLLETLLRKCQYHVTTTSQAITALKMLRENKNYFDLVISDVHMPDMDGFKLLELVGLEMDLPVIMLSANGDPKLVMKGITHGACDYLLKPVRIEELKNIWQHVIRRRQFDSREQNSSNIQVKNSAKGNGTGTVNSDKNIEIGKRRKDQNGDDDEEQEQEQDENEHENEDPSTQKRPRVVWSVELHRKFVEAVHQLGLEKAVPKKILELMNVEKLTRENVASHLQKYRLYLRRISSVANQQPIDSPYFRANFHNLSSSAQFHNTPAGPGLLGLSSSGISQGIPTSFDFDHFRHEKGVTGRENSGIFPVSRTFLDASGPTTSLLSQASLMNENMVQNKLDLLKNPKYMSTMLHGNTGFGSMGELRFGSFGKEQEGSLEDVVTRCLNGYD